jgi:pimeloyl-ACP methyl ester carboxylesterase
MANKKYASSKGTSLLSVAVIVLCAMTAAAQKPTDKCRPPPVIPLATESPAKIIIDPPLAGPLAARGVVVINYCAENLRFVPVFGPNALAVSPRVGHLHVRVDDASWVWADASGNPVILMGLSPGPHKVLIELVDTNHHTLDKGVVTFVIPVKPATEKTSTSTVPEFKFLQLTAGDAIRPFPQIQVPQEAIDNLRRRIADTQWPEKETVADSSQGVPLATIQQLARYWATDYDWRKAEAKLNALPQFVTTIDGLDIHFIHIRSPEKDALPLIISHGWPGSVLEQIKLIGPLTNPVAHGGNAEDAFDVVIPSMPGYGFSGKPTSTGWGPERMARAWAELMKRLGYIRYVAQGGDWGAFVVDQMGLQSPAGLLAIHTNMPATVPVDVDKALGIGAPAPAGLSAEEKRAYEQLASTFKQVDYARIMGSRPQTLYGIADSPVGLAAWLLDHNDADAQPAAAVVAGLHRTSSATGELTRDEILDNITLYWLTNTGVSASRLYWEYKGGFFNAKGVKIPVAVTVFPGEQYEAPRSWTERAYPKLIYYNKVDKGGHFAAWEQPMIFAAELRAAFKSLRVNATALKH